MSDLTPRDPTPRDPTPNEPPTPHDPELRELLRAVDPPEHHGGFWRRVDDRIDLVHALRTIETPEHLPGFWSRLDALIQAEPDRDAPLAEVVALRATVFADPPAPAPRARRARRLTRRRLERLVQLSAAAAVVAVLAGAVAWWGTRDDDAGSIAGPAGATSTTTSSAPPPTTVESLLGDVNRVSGSTPISSGPGAAASVPIGASPDGKFLYVAGPAPSNERCTFGSSAAGSTAAKWIYARPVDGKSPNHRILTDRVFADPRITVGPNQKVVVSDSCNGATKHVIASAEANGALSVDQDVRSPVPLAVEGAAWSASGTGLFLKGVDAGKWYRYSVATQTIDPVAGTDIAPNAQVIEQLVNDKIVSVTRNGTATWTVSVGNQQIGAINAPQHGDFTRAVRVDPHHDQLAIAGKDTLLVLTARASGEVGLGSYTYGAAAITWAADGNGLVAAPTTGGLEYLSFSAADAQPATRTLPGFPGVAYSLFSVPTSSSLVVRPAQGPDLVAGEALILTLSK